MPDLKKKNFYDEDYFKGKTRQSPPHTRELIYPVASRTATFLCFRCSPERVLDIGCAKGYLVEAFRSQGVRSVVGVDISMYEIGEHTSELQSPCNLVCRLLLEKKKYN